jgi:hypothetical protein
MKKFFSVSSDRAANPVSIKEEIVDLIKIAVPDMEHEEEDKNLDEKM